MPGLIDPSAVETNFLQMHVRASEFAEAMNSAHGTSLIVDEGALLVAVKSTFDDIERYKRYHLDEPETARSNSVKRSAYFTKWAVKFKPLVDCSTSASVPADADERIIPLIANVSFALAVSLAFLIDELGKPFRLSDAKQQEFAYDITYREMNGDSLLCFFQIVHDLVKGEPIIEF